MSSYPTLTAQDVSNSVIKPAEGTEITISSLYTSSETGTISYTYKWYKSERLSAPVECTYGVIPTDFKLFGADGESITASSVTVQMIGTYRCDVEAKNSSAEIIGQAVTYFTVMPPVITLSETNTIGFSGETV